MSHAQILASLDLPEIERVAADTTRDVAPQRYFPNPARSHGPYRLWDCRATWSATPEGWQLDNRNRFARITPEGSWFQLTIGEPFGGGTHITVWPTLAQAIEAGTPAGGGPR
jgi:hypothetical protein